jgi:hypothetical protein
MTESIESALRTGSIAHVWHVLGAETRGNVAARRRALGVFAASFVRNNAPQAAIDALAQWVNGHSAQATLDTCSSIDPQWSKVLQLAAGVITARNDSLAIAHLGYRLVCVAGDHAPHDEVNIARRAEINAQLDDIARAYL